MSKFEKGDYVRENDGTIGRVLDVEGESLCVCGGEHRYTYIGKVHHSTLPSPIPGGGALECSQIVVNLPKI